MGLGGLNLSLCEFPMETLRWAEGSSPGDRKLPQAIGNLTSPLQPVSCTPGSLGINASVFVITQGTDSNGGNSGLVSGYAQPSLNPTGVFMSWGIRKISAIYSTTPTENKLKVHYSMSFCF